MNEVGVGQRSQLASGEWKLNKVELSKEGRYGNLPYEVLGVEGRYGNLPYELVVGCRRQVWKPALRAGGWV